MIGSEDVASMGLTYAMCDVNEVVETLLKDKVSLSNLQIRPRTLDDLFLELTGKELRA